MIAPQQNLVRLLIAARRELEESVQHALRILPDDDRRVNELRNCDNLSFAEIGQHMEHTPDAVRMLWSRAAEQRAPRIDGCGAS